jgi:hypothetical protein
MGFAIVNQAFLMIDNTTLSLILSIAALGTLVFYLLHRKNRMQTRQKVVRSLRVMLGLKDSNAKKAA